MDDSLFKLVDRGVINIDVARPMMRDTTMLEKLVR